MMPPIGGLTAFRASQPSDQSICASQPFILDNPCHFSHWITPCDSRFLPASNCTWAPLLFGPARRSLWVDFTRSAEPSARGKISTRTRERQNQPSLPNPSQPPPSAIPSVLLARPQPRHHLAKFFPIPTAVLRPCFHATSSSSSIPERPFPSCPFSSSLSSPPAQPPHAAPSPPPRRSSEAGAGDGRPADLWKGPPARAKGQRGSFPRRPTSGRGRRRGRQRAVRPVSAAAAARLEVLHGATGAVHGQPVLETTARFGSSRALPSSPELLGLESAVEPLSFIIFFACGSRRSSTFFLPAPPDDFDQRRSHRGPLWWIRLRSLSSCRLPAWVEFKRVDLHVQSLVLPD